MQSIAIILAGGSGLRMNTDIPKQFISLAGKSVIQHSIEKIQASKLFDKLIIVCHRDYFNRIPQITSDIETHLIAGGKTRNESTENALKFIRTLLPNEDAVLMFHDAARPNISLQTLSALRKAMETEKVAVPVGEIKDTLYGTSPNGDFQNIIDRNLVFKAHTPQAFTLNVLEKAYQLKNASTNSNFTDDVSIVHHFLPQTNIFFVKDNPWNIKLTVPEDFKVLESLLT